MEALQTLRSWVQESRSIVFFGGAGVSTESGIPDFRSTDGLYHQKFDYPPEEILSHSFCPGQIGELYALTLRAHCTENIARPRELPG